MHYKSLLSKAEAEMEAGLEWSHYDLDIVALSETRLSELSATFDRSASHLFRSYNLTQFETYFETVHDSDNCLCTKSC